MDKKILVAFIAGLCIGVFIGIIIPYIQPKKTIYDKLGEANIVYSQGTWYEGNLEVAKHIQQIRDFKSFTWIYEEKHDPQYSDPEWIVHVYVDPDWNVVWIRVDSDTSIEYIGFYFYPEPD